VGEGVGKEDGSVDVSLEENKNDGSSEGMPEEKDDGSVERIGVGCGVIVGWLVGMGEAVSSVIRSPTSGLMSTLVEERKPSLLHIKMLADLHASKDQRFL
jgi:hypothetical protein